MRIAAFTGRVLALAVILMVPAFGAQAHIPPNNVLDQVVDTYRENASAREATLRGWLACLDGSSLTGIFVMAGSSIVMLALTKSVPDMVQCLINGTALASSSAITGAPPQSGRPPSPGWPG